MRVLVTGASGRLGGVVTPLLVAAGHEVRAMSRAPRPADGPEAGRDGAGWVVGDLATGVGLAAAVDGVDAVVHLASAPYQGKYTAAVDVGGTGRLIDAAARAGVGHLLYISIVGIDALPWAYFARKLAAERVVADADPGVPWSILRLTQFHPFVEEALDGMSRRLRVFLGDGRWRAQPVGLDDAAARVVAALAAGPTRRTDDFGGPEVLTYRELVDEYRLARGTRRPLLPLRVPGRLGRAFRDGSLATTAARPAGTTTWRDYLHG